MYSIDFSCRYLQLNYSFQSLTWSDMFCSTTLVCSIQTSRKLPSACDRPLTYSLLCCTVMPAPKSNK